MTRKTKEEKKLAEYRRKLKLLQQSSNSEKFNVAIKNKNGEATVPKEKTKETNIKSDQLYFKKDFLKSLVFILLIITLELIIYFARMNR